jgi:hypothetical protein
MPIEDEEFDKLEAAVKALLKAWENVERVRTVQAKEDCKEKLALFPQSELVYFLKGVMRGRRPVYCVTINGREYCYKRSVFRDALKELVSDGTGRVIKWRRYKPLSPFINQQTGKWFDPLGGKLEYDEYEGEANER